MLRFGGRRPAGSPPGDAGGWSLAELKDALRHLLKQLVRAEALLGGDRRIAGRVTLLGAEIDRASLPTDLTPICEQLQELRIAGDRLPGEPPSQSQQSQLLAAWLHSARALGKALDNPAHVPALDRVQSALDDSMQRAREGLEKQLERITDEVRWVRERGALLTVTLSQIGASLVTLAADGPRTTRRLEAIREQIEHAAAPNDIERLRKQLLEHTRYVIEELQRHQRSVEQARDAAVALAPMPAATTTEVSLLPPGLIGSQQAFDHAIGRHAKSGDDVLVMLLRKDVGLGAQHLSAALATCSDRMLEAYCDRGGRLVVLRTLAKGGGTVDGMRELATATLREAGVNPMTHPVAVVTTWGPGSSFDSVLVRAAERLEAAGPGATVLVT